MTKRSLRHLQHGFIAVTTMLLFACDNDTDGANNNSGTGGSTAVITTGGSTVTTTGGSSTATGGTQVETGGIGGGSSGNGSAGSGQGSGGAGGSAGVGGGTGGLVDAGGFIDGSVDGGSGISGSVDGSSGVGGSIETDATAGEAGGAGGTGNAVPSTGCEKTRTLQDGEHTISSSGQDRRYFLKAPSDYNNTHPYRLIFTFHWYYGSINAVVNPPDADHNTDRPFYGLEDLSENTAIFVAPQGLVDGNGAGWQNPNDRDVIFTDDMLKAISEDLCIDTSRVFTTGFSYGASMSYELACTRPDKFRAALLYNPGTLSGTNPSDCKTPIAIFQSHGVDDQTLKYDQGLSIFNIFTQLNGCTATTPPDPPQNGHTCISYEGCSPPARFCGFGSGENNPYVANLRGHYPTPKDPGESASWVPVEAWDFITQF